VSPEPAPRQTQSRVPNFTRFIITGAVIGLVVGVFFGMREPGGPSYAAAASYDTGSAMGLLGALGAMIGAGVAAIVALLLERFGRN
jgi:hypothetical protein